MTVYQAPAKLNLSLVVHRDDGSGRHPIDSLVQTIEWCDEVELEIADRDLFEIGERQPEEDLAVRALGEVRREGRVPPVRLSVVKRIPEMAGLGGGSSDAAAVAKAAAQLAGLPDGAAERAARRVGSDVPLFLTGGTLMVSGHGEVTEPRPPLDGFCVAVAVPRFGLSTPEVYDRWDELDRPVGEEAPASRVPPVLRGGPPLRNDLLPAALALEPRLGDFMADLRRVWGAWVMMTGSGSACFAFFPSETEANDAAATVGGLAAVTRGAVLRPRGVGPAEG